jgi:hypothetical protein
MARVELAAPRGRSAMAALRERRQATAASVCLREMRLWSMAEAPEGRAPSCEDRERRKRSDCPSRVSK